MAAKMESRMSLPTLAILHPAVQVLLLVVVLILVLFVLQSRKGSGPGNCQSKRYVDFEGLDPVEAIIERMAAMVTTFLGKVYRYLMTRTRGATVISLPSVRIVMVHPSMERVFGRYADSMSLAHNTRFFGKCVFDLSDDGIQRVTDYDSRAAHRHAFSSSEAVRELVEQATSFAQTRIDLEPETQETMLGAWLFKLVNTAVITAIWGPENPWAADEDGFFDRFVTFAKALPSFMRPWPRITARRGLDARDKIISQLRKFHFEHRESRTQQLAHRLNVIAITDPSWESNSDYFKVELLTTLGLAVSPSAVTVWLVRHLLSDPPTLRRVLSQVRSIDSASLDGGKIDVGHIHKTCPMLVASAYETMRLHVTAVPRVAKQDLELTLPEAESGSILQVKKGDVVVLPMTTFNLDPAVWGSNVDRFAPERFLARDGSVSEAAVRRLRVFGVAGNMCPGRKMGLSAVLSVTATVLRTFDIEPAADDDREARFPPPEASCELGIGFERAGDDVRATIRRVKG